MLLLLLDNSLIVLNNYNNYMRGCPSGLRGAAAKQPYELRYFSDEVCVNPAYSWVRMMHATDAMHPDVPSLAFLNKNN